ncbi:hypothetical protein [Bacteriovorax sp. DB6_IX]|uniref:hypothetical protein n=1 Tax=Bacteriovorax sp. DB6_IX TaxID=1353530 RepID=UPI00038A447A|nr:hypothetical protein [Bacteriovorax sp. DB6_IX]EQC44418.1 hypothetical protein M901_2260 [Bacteriovorax sp. DB6_IX]
MEIEILEQDASKQNIEYLEQLFFNLHGKDVEFKKVDSFSADTYKIISFNQYISGDNKRLTKFFLIHDGASSPSVEVSRIGRSTPECLGIIDLSQDHGCYIPFIDSFLSSQNVMDSQKVLLKKLNGVMQSVLGQLQRVKGLHEKVVPVRQENIRGLQVNSRFCAGTSSGGEFFDFFKVGSSIWLFSINASSYITIGSFLSLIDSWKQNSNLNKEHILQVLNNQKGDFSGIGDMSFFFARVDLNTYEMEAANIGGHELIGKEKIIISRNDQSYPDKMTEIKEYNYKIERGEQLILLSPGFFKNTSEMLGNNNYYQFIKSNWSDASDMIQELTYQSKKKYNDLDFMPFDQTILTLGVDKNAIAKI